MKLMGGVFFPVRFVNADSRHTISSNDLCPLPSTEEESKDFTKGNLCLLF